MAIHWVTFRVAMKTVGGKTYEQRYAAAVAAIKAHATSSWDDTTSFILLETASSRASLAASIKAAFSPAEDIALVGSMDTLGATLVGTTQYPATLKKLIPEVVQA